MKKKAPQQTIAEQLAQAMAWHRDGRLPQAAAAYRAILAAEADHFDALHLLGVCALQDGDAPTAHGLIARALALKPDDVTAQMHLANAQQRLGQPDAALRSYRRVLELAPDDAMAFNNCGNLLREMQRHAEALAMFERALQCDAHYAEAYNNLGGTLVDLHRHEEALLCFERALRLAPDYLDAHYNLGNALQLLGRTGAALCSYERALAIAPDDVEARVNAGICRLLQGDLQGGWRWYESRWRRLPLPDHAPPQWRGDAPLAGKTILVYAEQGLGDTIQMCRYVALLAAQGADVVLRVQPALKALLSQLAGARMVLADGEPLPAFDYHCSLMSLPFAFDTSLATIPAGAPYLRADPARAAAWAQRLGAPAGRRIGLAWSGNRGHDRDGSRSIPLMQLRGLFGADAQFVSLQPELRAIDRIVLENDQRIASHAAQLTDFAETAALIAQLDLVISVDTSVAHLAAAMGKPVWLLLAYAPDWRWLLERDDSPWYPTMRLFRQSVRGDWDGVVAEVARALRRCKRE